jgi:hypothetical protein
VQGRLGRGFTLLGTAGLGLSSGKSAGSVEELELLKDVVAPAQGSRVSVGLGVRREWEGTSVLLGRVTAGRRFERSELVANLRLERAFSAQRDALDVVTTVGWLHGWGDTLKVGLEGVGEDLEGLWETEEAEGGAKLFVGPSLHIAPPGRSWSLSLCGGPLLLDGRRTSTSSASRELGTSPGRAYTVRLSVGYTF